MLLPLLLLATATTACTPQAPPVGGTAPITQEQERATGASYPKAVEDEAVAEMVHAMDEALTAGDVDAFLEHVSPELHEEQRSWFEAVASVPMDVRGLRADRIASRRSPEGTVVHVGLRHRIQGGDPEPVMQQYRWTVAPGEDGRPLLMEATGRNGQFFGNPAPWDLGPVAALEGDGVLVLAPEDARSEAEFLLPGLEAAAREVLEDFPILAEDRQVLVVQLVTADVLADALDVDEDEGWTAGLAWLYTSPDDPGGGRSGAPALGVGRLGPVVAPRVMIDLDWAVQDRQDWGVGPGGDVTLRYYGASAALQGDDLDHHAAEWLVMGVSEWYSTLRSRDGEENLRDWVSARLGGTSPQSLPPIAPTQGADPEEVTAVAAGFALYLSDTYGADRVMELAQELLPLDGWYDDTRISEVMTSTLGASEEELLAGWQEWVAGLEERAPASVEGR